MPRPSSSPSFLTVQTSMMFRSLTGSTLASSGSAKFSKMLCGLVWWTLRMVALKLVSKAAGDEFRFRSVASHPKPTNSSPIFARMKPDGSFQPVHAGPPLKTVRGGCCDGGSWEGANGRGYNCGAAGALTQADRCRCALQNLCYELRMLRIIVTRRACNKLGWNYGSCNA